MKRVVALPLLLFFGFALFGLGCGAQAPQKVAVEEKRAVEPTPASQPAPPAAAGERKEPAGAVPRVPPGAVAVVNGERITVAEFRENLSQMGAGSSHTAIDGRAALDRLIDTLLLEQEAEKAGYRKDPALRRRIEIFERLLLGDLYLQTLRREVIQSQPVTEEEILKRSSFGRLLYDVDAILVESIEDAVPVYNRLKAGESFEELARELSVGLTAALGGKVGPHPADHFLRMYGVDIEGLGLKPGQVSNPLATKIGYVILRFNGNVNSELTRQFEDIVTAIQETKGQPKFQEQFQKIVDALPAVFNAEHLKNGTLVVTAFKGRSAPLPPHVYARLGNYDVTRATIEEVGGPTLFTPKYAPFVMTVVEKLLYEEYFAQEAEKSHPELKNSPEYRQRLEREERIAMRKKLVTDRIGSRLKAERPEIEEFYRQNVRNYLHGRQWELRHFLFTDQKTAEQFAAALAAGQDLEALARELSRDDLREKGGYLGIVEEGQLTKRFDQAIRTLTEGVMTPPIRDDAGFHIFMAIKVIPAQNRGLAEVEGEIRETVLNQKLARDLKLFTGALRHTASILVDLDLVAAIEKEFASPHGKGQGMKTRGSKPPGHPDMGKGRPAGHP